MIKLFWWRNTIKLNKPHTVAKSLKKYFHYKLPLNFKNFGDELSPAIVSNLTHETVTFSSEPGKILSLGSILHFAKSSDCVWGTGLLKESILPQTVDIKICSVRGALTREVLTKKGYDCPSVYGDPGLLAPYLWKKKETIKYEVGIIPHWSQFRYLSKYISSSSTGESIKVISAADPWEKVITEINQCQTIVSTSLHGLILSDAYGIPRTMYYVGQPPDLSWFKYEDYSSSINADFMPYEAGSSIESIVSLSKKSTLNLVNEGIPKKMISAAPFTVKENILKSI